MGCGASTAKGAITPTTAPMQMAKPANKNNPHIQKPNGVSPPGTKQESNSEMSGGSKLMAPMIIIREPTVMSPKFKHAEPRPPALGNVKSSSGSGSLKEGSSGSVQAAQSDGDIVVVNTEPLSNSLNKTHTEPPQSVDSQSGDPLSMSAPAVSKAVVPQDSPALNAVPSSELEMTNNDQTKIESAPVLESSPKISSTMVIGAESSQEIQNPVTTASAPEEHHVEYHQITPQHVNELEVQEEQAVLTTSASDIKSGESSLSSDNVKESIQPDVIKDHDLAEMKSLPSLQTEAGKPDEVQIQSNPVLNNSLDKQPDEEPIKKSFQSLNQSSNGIKDTSQSIHKLNEQQDVVEANKSLPVLSKAKSASLPHLLDKPKEKSRDALADQHEKAGIHKSNPILSGEAVEEKAEQKDQGASKTPHQSVQDLLKNQETTQNPVPEHVTSLSQSNNNSHHHKSLTALNDNSETQKQPDDKKLGSQNALRQSLPALNDTKKSQASLVPAPESSTPKKQPSLPLLSSSSGAKDIKSDAITASQNKKSLPSLLLNESAPKASYDKIPQSPTTRLAEALVSKSLQDVQQEMKHVTPIESIGRSGPDETAEPDAPTKAESVQQLKKSDEQLNKASEVPEKAESVQHQQLKGSTSQLDKAPSQSKLASSKEQLRSQGTLPQISKKESMSQNALNKKEDKQFESSHETDMPEILTKAQNHKASAPALHKSFDQLHQKEEKHISSHADLKKSLPNLTSSQPLKQQSVADFKLKKSEPLLPQEPEAAKNTSQSVLKNSENNIAK